MAVAIVYTKSGGGKTVNSTLVEGKSFLMDSDNSSIVLRNFERPDVTIHQINKILQEKDNPADTDYFIKDFEKASASKLYNNIILDNGTDIIDRWLLEMGERGKNGGNPQLQDYQTVYNGFKRLIRAATLSQANVIITFWQDTFTVTQPNGQLANMISPKMPPKILENICGLANVVARVETFEKDGKLSWYYRLEGTPTVYAKDQLFCRKTCLPEDLFNGKGKK